MNNFLLELETTKKILNKNWLALKNFQMKFYFCGIILGGGRGGVMGVNLLNVTSKLIDIYL